MDQQISKLKKSRKEMSQQIALIKNMQQVQDTLTNQLNEDPNKLEKIRLDRYLKDAERIDAELQEQTLEFISPQQMVEVLKDIIRQERGLRLVSLESLDVEDPVTDPQIEFEKPETSGNESDSPVAPGHSGAYLHTMELKFKGDYMSAMNYLARLEKLEWKFIWKSLSIKLEDYPVTNVELQLQTLGLTEGWIGV